MWNSIILQKLTKYFKTKLIILILVSALITTNINKSIDIK
jgi:hypothetical protein